jgi:hypothetical protein
VGGAEQGEHGKEECLGMPSTEARTGGRKLLEDDPVVGDRRIIGERERRTSKIAATR